MAQSFDQLACLKRMTSFGPCWWSSGQHARLLLWRSELESRWSLQFISVKFVFEKNENKQKEAGVGPFYTKRMTSSSCQSRRCNDRMGFDFGHATTNAGQHFYPTKLFRAKRGSRVVWPDGEVKSSQNVTQVNQIVAQPFLDIKWYFANSPKSHQSFLATLVSNSVGKNFQKLPNLATLFALLLPTRARPGSTPVYRRGCVGQQ